MVLDVLQGRTYTEFSTRIVLLTHTHKKQTNKKKNVEKAGRSEIILSFLVSELLEIGELWYVMVLLLQTN